MPLAALIEDKILCMHGGLSPELENLEQIQKIERPLEVPEEGLVTDLLWADPEKEVRLPLYGKSYIFKARGWQSSDRGVSWVFGPDVVTGFAQKHDIDLVCRAHQVTHFNLFLLCQQSRWSKMATNSLRKDNL